MSNVRDLPTDVCLQVYGKFNCHYEMFLILEVVYNNHLTLHIVRWCSTNAAILSSIYGITILMCILKLVCMLV